MLAIERLSLFIFIDEPSSSGGNEINHVAFSGMISDDSQVVLLPTIFIIITHK